MLITFTEADLKHPVSINPSHIVSVFTLQNTDSPETARFVGKTAIVLVNGNVVVDEEYLEVVGRINGEINSCCK
jgi:uncharacterized protein YlzI (FlbEa/FlbD family)